MTCPIDNRRCYATYNKDDGLFHHCRHGYSYEGFCPAHMVQDNAILEARKNEGGS
jgi:hypothetical protein